MSVTVRVRGVALSYGQAVRARIVAAVLLPVLLLFVADLLHQGGASRFGAALWDMDLDRSAMELYGYGLVSVAGLLLLLCAARHRGGPVYAGWALTLCVIALDDALTWHERGGAWLVARAPVPDLPGLREQDFGELVVWTCLGAATALLLAATHLRSPREARQDSLAVAGLVLVLTVFGVGVDMLSIAVRAVSSTELLHLVIDDVEGTGEVVAMAALLAFSVSAYRRVSERTAVP